MRGRPRGSRNKMPSQRRGSGKLSPDMIGAMREDESMNFAEYQLGAKGGYDKVSVKSLIILLTEGGDSCVM